VAVSAFVPGGLGRHSADELRRLLAGRNVATRLMPAEDGFELIGNTTPADLGLQLELMAAQLTDAGWRPEALRQTRENITQLYQGFTHTPNGPMMLEMANLIASGDPRFGLPAKEVMLSRTLEEAKAWLGPQFARGPLEITLVGDFEPEAAIAAVARTLGALPARAPRTDLATLKHVAFPATPFTRAFRITSEIPKGNALVYWPTTDGLDIRRARRLNLLASVLRDRLRVTIREQLGDTYSANAVSFASDTFPGYGHLQSGCVVDPAQAERILEVILATGQDLATAGVTEDELARARAPVLTTAREAQRTNNYWGTALARAQERPEMLEWARTRVSDLEAITVAELNDLARTFLTRDRASRVTILPDVPPPASGAK
jgi:zinc protease